MDNIQMPIPHINPEKTLESFPDAPLDRFSADRVSEPDAGIPLKKAQPILAIPEPKISLFNFGESPVLEAIDLVTTEISSVIKNANPIATPDNSQTLSMRSEGLLKTLKSGKNVPPSCSPLNV